MAAAGSATRAPDRMTLQGPLPVSVVITGFSRVAFARKENRISGAIPAFVHGRQSWETAKVLVPGISMDTPSRVVMTSLNFLQVPHPKTLPYTTMVSFAVHGPAP